MRQYKLTVIFLIHFIVSRQNDCPTYSDFRVRMAEWWLSFINRRTANRAREPHIMWQRLLSLPSLFPSFPARFTIARAPAPCSNQKKPPGRRFCGGEGYTGNKAILTRWSLSKFPLWTNLVELLFRFRFLWSILILSLFILVTCIIPIEAFWGAIIFQNWSTLLKLKSRDFLTLY